MRITNTKQEGVNKRVLDFTVFFLSSGDWEDGSPWLETGHSKVLIVMRYRIIFTTDHRGDERKNPVEGLTSMAAWFIKRPRLLKDRGCLGQTKN
jgi:hypothetical protein